MFQCSKKVGIRRPVCCVLPQIRKQENADKANGTSTLKFEPPWPDFERKKLETDLTQIIDKDLRKALTACASSARGSRDAAPVFESPRQRVVGDVAFTGAGEAAETAAAGARAASHGAEGVVG
eukprot:9912882-Alexandrium_andersonii.AAC.1